MTHPTLDSLDRAALERVLGMGSGYVLDFRDRDFAALFSDFGVDIDEAAYRVQGTSKAHRLRAFLQTASPPLVGRVLATLLDHRLAQSGDAPSDSDLVRYRAILVRLGSPRSATASAKEPAVDPETALLKLAFRKDAFARLPLDAAMCELLVARMDEAHRCIATKAHLSAVILCGSVLEGMCLGAGSRTPERVNRAFTEKYNKPAPKLADWKLHEWIDVLARLGDFSPNVSKFGHALRDFRNYVHPAEQLAHRFEPDDHTARISFQVVLAAVADLTRTSPEANAQQG